jgi:hypothetical protein
MVTVGKTGSRIRLGIGIIVVLVILAMAALITIRLVTGRGLGLRSLPRTMLSLVRAVNDRKAVTGYNRGNFTNIIFLHHSTGNNLVEQGGVRERFTQAGYDFWDHSYNNPGLRDPFGSYTGYSYMVPRDNTDPDGLATIFSQRVYDLPLNTLSGLFQHEVIIFKSCFAPANHITSDQQLEQYKAWYVGMREVMGEHPEKLFVVMTFPPLNPAETTPDEAFRARAFANWLKSDEFLNRYPNIATLDFFDLLAESNPVAEDFNMLRADYREGSDSHPNRIANEAIGPIFVDFVINSIQEYKAVVPNP